LLADPGFLDKGEFDVLAKTLEEEKVVCRVLSKYGNTFIPLIIYENR